MPATAHHPHLYFSTLFCLLLGMTSACSLGGNGQEKANGEAAKFTDEPPDWPRWEVEGRDWPGREASRFAEVNGINWHYQVFGSGPVLLLVHGTAAASHSWHPLIPDLAKHFTVINLDLPGHGFTSRPAAERFVMTEMAVDLTDLLEYLGYQPDLVVGHSAGAALLARMIVDGHISPQALISINGSFIRRQGLLGRLFTPISRLIFESKLAANFFSGRVKGQKDVEDALKDMGTELDDRQVELYTRLVRTPGHIGSALHMMARWQLYELEPHLAELELPVILVVGEDDGLVDPKQADFVASQIPNSSVTRLKGLGHFAHEEDPQRALEVILDTARRLGI
jgi:magnesium chelatase accessory protein